MLPTQKESPNGLHQRYVIGKLIPTTDEEKNSVIEAELKRRGGEAGYGPIKVPDFKVIPVDPNAEYFVLRLDGKGEMNHVAACRIAVNAYADAIEPHLPQLAADLRERYPQPSPWIAVSERLPEPYGLVRIKRSYNGKESEYIGYRNNRPVYTGSDPSTDCAWWGLSSDDMTAPDGSIRTELLDHLSNYSDITVEAWQPLFPAPQPPSDL